MPPEAARDGDVSFPSEPTVKTLIVPRLAFATYRRFPFGEIAMEVGLIPAANGELGTAPRLPFLGSTVKAEISDEPWLATNRNGALGEAAMEIGPVPVLKMLDGVGGGMGLVVTGTESCPLPRFTLSRVTLLPA